MGLAARSLLAQVAAGQTVSGALLAELAQEVLGQRAVALAQEILAGGPHRLRAAIELAALVLAEETDGMSEGGEREEKAGG